MTSIQSIQRTAFCVAALFLTAGLQPCFAKQTESLTPCPFLLENSGFTRMAILATWKLETLWGGRVPFEAQPVQFFQQFTPAVFQTRPLGSDLESRRSELEKVGKALSDEEAQKILDYLRNALIFDKLSDQIAANFKARFPNGVQGSMGLFEFQQNASEALILLRAYSSKNTSRSKNAGLLAGLALINHFNWPGRASKGDPIYQEIAEQVLNAEQPYAIRDFFEALAESPAPERFYALPNALPLLQAMFTKLESGLSASLPEFDHLQKVMKEAVYYYIWKSQTYGRSIALASLRNALALTKATENYLQKNAPQESVSIERFARIGALIEKESRKSGWASSHWVLSEALLESFDESLRKKYDSE